MLQCEGLGVPSIEPRQHVLSRMAHPCTYFADRRLERFVVAESSLPKRLFNRVVEVVGLILSDAPRADAPRAPPPSRRAFRGALAGRGDRQGHACMRPLREPGP